MNIKTIAALLFLTSASLALPQDSLAGRLEGRMPQLKDCPFDERLVTDYCQAELKYAYDVVEWLLRSNIDDSSGRDVKVNFLSRKNPDNDAETLQCKISGAHIKLSQDKAYKASYLMYKALEKIWSLYGQGKLGGDALADMNAAFTVAKECIDS